MILSLSYACAYSQMSLLQKSFVSGSHLCGFPNCEGSMGAARHCWWIPQWRCEYPTNLFMVPIYSGLGMLIKYFVSQGLLKHTNIETNYFKAFKNSWVCKPEIQKQIAGEDFLLQFKHGHGCQIFSVFFKKFHLSPFFSL